jgi:DNA polymerase-3 subunit alpha
MKTLFICTFIEWHSDRSILDSTIQIKKLIPRVRDLGQRAVAVTDHGVVSGAINLYKECLKTVDKDGNSITLIKPLIGAELYLSPTDDHTRAEKIEGLPDYYHINLLALDAQGVSQLYKLSSLGYEGFYRKPRVSLPLIEEIGKNLLVLGACVKGPVAWNIFVGEESRALDFLRRMKEMFGDRFYLELMDHGLEWQKPLNRELERLSHLMEVPWVPTNDAHFLTKEDHYNHSLWMCLQINKKLEEFLSEGKMVYPENCYVRGGGEMQELFGKEACLRTVEVAERINIELELDVPKFPIYKEEQDEH